MKEKWVFTGRVERDGTLITRNNYVATTLAETPRKAVANLKYRIRKECRLAYNVPLMFSGELYNPETGEICEFVQR